MFFLRKPETRQLFIGHTSILVSEVGSLVSVANQVCDELVEHLLQILVLLFCENGQVARLTRYTQEIQALVCPPETLHKHLNYCQPILYNKLLYMINL